MRVVISFSIALCVFLWMPAPQATAQDWVHGMGDSGPAVDRPPADPLDIAWSFTQNDEPDTIVPGWGTSCQLSGVTLDNHWWRLYELREIEIETGVFLTGDVCVKRVDYGVEISDDGRETNGGVPLGPLSEQAQVGCMPLGTPPFPAFLPLDEVEIVDSATRASDYVGPGGPAEFRSFPVDGCCDAETESMLIGIGSPDNCTEDNYGPGGPGTPPDGLPDCRSYKVGHNPFGGEGNTFIQSAGCALADVAVCYCIFAFFLGDAIQVVHVTAADPMPARPRPACWSRSWSSWPRGPGCSGPAGGVGKKMVKPAARRRAVLRRTMIKGRASPACG